MISGSESSAVSLGAHGQGLLLETGKLEES